ncbi:MAG: hypothetical protein LBC02_10115 [Planctomycetaceae bacterium]|jgi:hypothetical protein|nr:hypothetical protein [Planctomycetaceae bacterium]
MKIYLDTSVVSMLDDSLRGIVTRKFFNFAKQQKYEFAVSEVVNTEIGDVSEIAKRETILQFLETLSCVFLPYSEESHSLAWKYVLDGVLT